MEKLSAKAKYSFGVGAIGKDAVVNLVGIYLMFYITDVLGLSPAFVGTLFFIARIWYATNDPVMGMVVDNTHSRFGKFRPWIVIGTLVNSVIFVLLFTNFGLSTTELYVYISIAYLLYGMTYTIMDIPYWSWLPSLTNDPREREEVSVIPRFFASLAGMLIGTFGLYMIDFFDRSFGGSGDRQTGFTVSAIVIAIIFIATIAVTVFNVPEKPTNRNAPRIKFKQIGKLLAKNDQLVAFIGILLSFNLAMQIVNGVTIYYFKYVTGAEHLFSIFNFMITAEMLSLLLFPRLVKAFNRTKVFTLACSLVGIGLVIILAGGYIAPQSPLFIIVGSFLLKFGSGLSLGITTVSIADVIDYGELKFGIRSESIIVSTQTFLMKAAQAVSGLLTGVGLSLVGYVPDAVQTPGTVMGLRILMIAIPLLFAALSLFIYLKAYKLKGSYLSQIVSNLKEKNAENEKNEENIQNIR
ncbi:melibiose:sodium transporter MelB [Priestia endophytica]|uniref:melibiose:sodium transporter MelB n=1 Tax=Priestia endophytica TaxID=135735 RepID=UPI00227E1B3A|nr:melibiose:sodium transporter MelB [Priestia endophytica]MCY8232230.1 melibiose:sodium transporter MelB [Priestia endophytica]